MGKIQKERLELTRRRKRKMHKAGLELTGRKKKERRKWNSLTNPKCLDVDVSKGIVWGLWSMQCYSVADKGGTPWLGGTGS